MKKRELEAEIERLKKRVGKLERDKPDYVAIGYPCGGYAGCCRCTHCLYARPYNPYVYPYPYEPWRITWGGSSDITTGTTSGNITWTVE